MSKKSKICSFAFTLLFFSIIFICMNFNVNASDNTFRVSDKKMKKCGYGATYSEALQQYHEIAGISKDPETITLLKDGEISKSEFESIPFFVKVDTIDTSQKTLKIIGSEAVNLEKLSIKFTNVNLVSQSQLTLCSIDLINSSLNVPEGSSFVNINIYNNCTINAHSNLILASKIAVTKDSILTFNIDYNCKVTAKNIVLQTNKPIILTGSCVANGQAPLCTNINASNFTCTDSEIQQDDSGLMLIKKLIQPDPVIPPQEPSVTPQEPSTPPQEPSNPPQEPSIPPQEPNNSPQEPSVPPQQQVNLPNNSDSTNSDSTVKNDAEQIIILQNDSIPLINNSDSNINSNNPKTSDDNCIPFILLIAILSSVFSYKISKSRHP